MEPTGTLERQARQVQREQPGRASTSRERYSGATNYNQYDVVTFQRLDVRSDCRERTGKHGSGSDECLVLDSAGARRCDRREGTVGSSRSDGSNRSHRCHRSNGRPGYSRYPGCDGFSGYPGYSGSDGRNGRGWPEWSQREHWSDRRDRFNGSNGQGFNFAGAYSGATKLQPV